MGTSHCEAERAVTYELKVKGKFETFKMEVSGTEVDHIVLHLVNLEKVSSVRVKKL
jgi:hypothetical protein